MEPSREQLMDLLRRVAETRSEELNCEEFLSGVGAFLECSDRSGELPPELDRVRQHLKVCPSCLEEFELMLQAYREP